MEQWTSKNISEQVFAQLVEPMNVNECSSRKRTLFLYISYPKQQEKFDALVHLRARENEATYSIGSFNADLERNENKKLSNNIVVRKVEDKLLRRSFSPAKSNRKCEFYENFDIESSCGDQAVYYYDKRRQLCQKSCLTSENKPFASLDECNSACNNILYHRVKYSIEFEMTSHLSDVDYYVMVLLGNEMIVDKLRVNITENGNCVERLRFQLNATSARVRDTVAMAIEAKPGSVCAVSAIDQSLLFMGKQNHLDPLQLLDTLRKQMNVIKIIGNQENYPENEYKMSDHANPINVFRVIFFLI